MYLGIENICAVGILQFEVSAPNLFVVRYAYLSYFT
jgi:hypothetical protein